jgi:D-sedoheptulose 7-phosphate isomerase
MATVFARQLRALGQPGDLFIAFSTSGESENLVQAVVAGRQRGLSTVAITGDAPSRLGRLAELTIRTPAGDTAVVQELHTVVTHLLCDIAEAALTGEDGMDRQ